MVWERGNQRHVSHLSFPIFRAFSFLKSTSVTQLGALEKSPKNSDGLNCCVVQRNDGENPWFDGWSEKGTCWLLQPQPVRQFFAAVWQKLRQHHLRGFDPTIHQFHWPPSSILYILLISHIQKKKLIIISLLVLGARCFSNMFETLTDTKDWCCRTPKIGFHLPGAKSREVHGSNGV